MGVEWSWPRRCTFLFFFAVESDAGVSAATAWPFECVCPAVKTDTDTGDGDDDDDANEVGEEGAFLFPVGPVGRLPLAAPLEEARASVFISAVMRKEP